MSAPAHPERLFSDSWPFRPWVRVDRGGYAESFHEGLLVVVDHEGSVVARWGNPDWPVFLRSSLKMIQALPLVESGAAEAFGLGPRELALCCASHSGEPSHVEGVRSILQRCALGPEVLHCGPHPPVHEESARALAMRGESPGRIHNNCSGKHAGMLATCVHRGWDTGTYWQLEHPLQQEILSLLAELAGVDSAAMESAVDGCGVPTHRVPAVRFAYALARFVTGAAAAGRHARACGILFEAMSAHPEMVGGAGRFCTELARAANRAVLAKAGAEGVYALAWREEDGRGMGLAAKAAAGDARSRNFAVTEAARQLGLLDGEGLRRMRPFHTGPLRNRAGEEVGRLVSLMELRLPSR